LEPIELGFPPEIGAANPASKQKGFFAYGVAAAVSRAVLRGDGRISEPGEIGRRRSPRTRAGKPARGYSSQPQAIWRPGHGWPTEPKGDTGTLVILLVDG